MVSSANRVTGEVTDPLTVQRIREAALRVGLFVKEDNAALEKSRRLLLENLDETQRRCFILHKYFDLISREIPYRLCPDITERLTDHTRYCVVFPGLPIFDQVLARKLFLECDPDEFFRVANVFPPQTAMQAMQFNSRPYNTRISETFRRASQELLARIARRYDIHPGNLRLDMTEVDFAHAYEFEVFLGRDQRRSFRVEREHFFTQGFEEVIEQHLRAVVADMAKQARTEYERNRRLEYRPGLGRGVLGDDEPLW